MAALAYTGHNIASWCAANGLDESYVSRVLNGRVTSAPMCRRFDSYADVELRRALVAELTQAVPTQSAS